MSEGILFDRDQVERLNDIADRPKRLRRSELLWVDVDRGSEEDARRVAETFGLDRETRACLETSKDRAIFRDHGRYIHVTTYAPHEDDEGELISLECVVGERWVVTAHDEPIPVLEEFAERVSGSGNTGSLDGPGFLAALLEWVLGSYSAAFERIEHRLEDFDVHAMRGDGDADKDIERLIADAARGRESPARARSSPLSARVADASGARSARRPRTPASSFSRCFNASSRPCKRHVTRARRSSAPSTSSSPAAVTGRTRS